MKPIAASTYSSLPLEKWSRDMEQAVDEIVSAGSKLLRGHGAAGERAEQVAEKWKLSPRLDEEQHALKRAFSGLQQILSAIERVRELIADEDVAESKLCGAMRQSASLISEQLPRLQEEFATIRHAALDLLRWVQRFAQVEGSSLPQEYRAAYGRLLDYTHVFQPFLQNFQEELVRRMQNSSVAPEYQSMLASVGQYEASVDAARAFVRSVVDPPKELVFHDTESFQNDWTSLDLAEQAQVATEINDCCQRLIYDTSGFHQLVDNFQRSIAEDLEASIYVLPVGERRVIFTMDDDPVFEQLVVTLLRVTGADELGDELDTLFSSMYSGFSGE